jgi:hypothetical protein
VCHHNIFHRGTKETLGRRRVMLKVSVDRTRNPTRPSWRHERVPAWSPETLRLSPWVPAVFCWMAGAPEPQPEPERERARLQAAVLSEADGREQARAAWRLARTQHPDALAELLWLLSECTAGVSTEAAAVLPPDAREVRLATTVAAFGKMASAPVCARLGARRRVVSSNNVRRTLLLVISDNPYKIIYNKARLKDAMANGPWPGEAGVGAHERALLLDCSRGDGAARPLLRRGRAGR